MRLLRPIGALVHDRGSRTIEQHGVPPATDRRYGGGTIKYVDAYCGQNRPRSPPNQAQKIDFIGGNDWGPGPHHLYIVRSIYCALLTPYGAEFARIRRHFCCQPNLLVADRFGG